MARRPIDFDRPRLFEPSTFKRILDHNGGVFNKNAQDLVDSDVTSTASFRYDPTGIGIRSTQQIPVDFSKFETHTFFNSAEVNVNVAFEKIINEFPFDGTKREIESFLDSLTGFEKWIFDSFPKNVGFLNFSGSAGTSSTDGTYIVVNDYAGYLYPSISKKRTGENIIDPGLKSFCIEMHAFLPTIANANQVICQKMSGSQHGITLAVSQSASTTACDLIFAVSSGSLILSASAQIIKGQFNHIVATLNRHPGTNIAQLYVNEILVGQSTGSAELGVIGFPTSPFVIGSGTIHDRMHSSSPAIDFQPSATFSGSIDELRVYHATRAIKDQKLFGRKSIYASNDLKLYFKFNEPTGSIGTDALVIDSSGNSLHSLVSNLGAMNRLTGSISSAMRSEKLSLNPVLFPAYDDVKNFNEDLLVSASSYDALNPNLITKLVPPHYFQEGQVFEALDDETGTISQAMSGSSIPGSAKIGSPQLLSAFLYVWASFFDEIKMMIDLFGNLIHVDYDKTGFTADQFLQFLARYYGFEMPAFFVNASIEQFIDAENIRDSVGTSSSSLQFVQNQLWRRILTNIGEIIRSKGTLHSVKSLLRSIGVDPNESFRIREYGGPTFRSLENARDDKNDITMLLNFSGSLATVAEALDAHGVNASKPFLRSPFLIADRVEPGYPEPVGDFVAVRNGVSVSDHASDALLTSGSWTYEGLYRFSSLLTGSHAVTQSLVRLCTTGSLAAVSDSGGLIANLLAISGSGLVLYVSPGYSGSSHPLLTLELTSSDVMNGKPWHISFGRQRADEIGAFVSSSYFLRAGRQEFGSFAEGYTTSSLFVESGSTAGAHNVLEHLSPEHNASGSFFVIGSQSIDQGAVFLNDSALGAAVRLTEFSGLLGHVRFWSKALGHAEWKEHVTNFRSLGVQTPKTNFNFVTMESGSFEKLRLDVSLEQVITRSASDGTFSAFDFSQNEFHLTGTGFEVLKDVMSPQRMFYSQLSPRFDEAASNQKVRIRSFKNYNNVDAHGGAIAPVYEIPRSESPNDDVRFSIDFSIADALDDDIVKLFATFDELDNVLGNPELLFSPDYPGLENLRDVYFNRLTQKMKFRQFFEFFKWFDSVLGISMFIEQLVPRKTKFLGTNFVVESHMLERPKFEYLSTDIYLGENDRNGSRSTILLQQFLGILRKF